MNIFRFILQLIVGIITLFFIGSIILLVIVINIIIWIPAFPLMILAFPALLLWDDPYKPKHWSTKPYMWYFNNVWLKYIGRE